MNQNKITSLEIKHALMYYYRFTRQYICASECLCNDVMIIKRAKKIHKNFNPDLSRKIMMRVCSENIGLIGNLLK